jgi:TatD DNase family protein
MNPMRLFDSHCHLDDPGYDDDREAVLERARKADVCAVMIAGIDRKTSEKALSIAWRHPMVFCSVGFHPHDVKSCREEDLDHLKALAHDPRVRAWGEIGLDFNRMYSPVSDQENGLIRQLEIADELNLPIIFHERQSDGRLIAILKQHHRHPGNGVIHCFSGSPTELETYIDMGYSIGITGILTIRERGKALRDMLPSIPLDRMLIETDAPYLTPSPQKNRIRRNEPAFVRTVFETIGQILDIPLPQLAETIWQNTCKLYHIDPDAEYLSLTGN